MADRIVDAAEQGMQGFLGDQYTGAHTKRLIKAAITAFDGFLIQKGIQRDVISKLSTAEVNDLLRTFYSEMKKADGERYAKKSMISLRYGLQKYFLKLRKEDIVTDKKFSSSNAVFKALIKKLEADGIGETKQKIPICPQDIAKLYSTVFNTDTPQGLQNKTMFEYLYYFCKRKRQSLRELTKGDFIICVDSAGREFVTVRERPTQNSIRGNGGDPGSSKQTRMYDRPGLLQTLGDSGKMARFASLEEAQLEKLVNDRDAENTQRSTRSAVKVFRGYLTEKGLSPDFELLGPEELDSLLCKFYAEARTVGGKLYKRSTLFSIKHGLNRHLLVNSPASLDITHGKDFIKSQLAFKAATKDLKRNGMGEISHYPPIEVSDLRLMYQYFDLQDNVKLQEKVFVDVILYFGRRGRENLHKLRTTDFIARRDSEGRLYIDLEKGKDTQIQQTDTNQAEGRMYAMPDNPLYCPVTSFLEYKRRLNPNCVRFFQRPKRSHEHCHLWYDNVAMGHNTLGNMMAKISQKAGLSQRYTNHSLRVTLLQSQDSTGDPSCPVTSFKKYISKLHPDNPNFWQRAKKRVRDSDGQWYDKASLGKNTLNSFMSSLSEEAGLSQRYTNHCIKTTSVAVLDNQAVDVTSHNSRLEDQRKREMSDILCQNLPLKSATTGFQITAASSTPTHTNSWSGKDDHFTGMNEYRNLLVGDAASAWKRLIGRFYWLNDSDIAKHLIEVHEIHCHGSCPLERTQDTPNSGPVISNKQQVLDLMPSTDTQTGNKDILLQLEVDEEAESIDEDSSDDSDLQGDEDFDIKQEQLSEDDTPPTSPGTTLPRTRQTAPSTSIHTNNPGGDNLALTEVKLEPVETFSSNFPLGDFTADKSRPQKHPVLTNTDYSIPIPPSSHSSVTSNTAPTRPFIPKIIQKAMQESDRTGTGAPRTVPSSVNFVYPLLNTVTSTVKQVHPPSSQNSAVAQNINPVTPPTNIIRAQLPLTVNTPAAGNAVNLPQSIPYFTIQRGNALYLQQAPAPQALQQTANPHVLPRLHVLQQDTTPHVVQQTTTPHVVQQATTPQVQQTTIPHVQQTTIPHVVQQATTPHVQQGTTPHVVQQVIIPRVVQQAPTPQSIAQTFSNFVNPLTTSLSPLGGADLQSESPASQGFHTETTTGHCLPVEDNLTGRDSVKRPLSDIDEGPGTSKRLITVKEETESEMIGEPV